MTEDKSKTSDAPTLEEIADGDLDSAQGGAGYLKIPDIEGESQIKYTPSDVNWKISPVDVNKG